MGRFELGLSERWVTVVAVLHRTTASSTPVVGHDGVTGTISAPPRKISRDLRLYKPYISGLIDKSPLEGLVLFLIPV